MSTNNDVTAFKTEDTYPALVEYADPLFCRIRRRDQVDVAVRVGTPCGQVLREGY